MEFRLLSIAAIWDVHIMEENMALNLVIGSRFGSVIRDVSFADTVFGKNGAHSQCLFITERERGTVIFVAAHDGSSIRYCLRVSFTVFACCRFLAISSLC